MTTLKGIKSTKCKDGRRLQTGIPPQKKGLHRRTWKHVDVAAKVEQTRILTALETKISGSRKYWGTHRNSVQMRVTILHSAGNHCEGCGTYYKDERSEAEDRDE